MHPYDIHIKFEYGYGYPYLRFKRIRIRIIRMFRHPNPSLPPLDASEEARGRVHLFGSRTLGVRWRPGAEATGQTPLPPWPGAARHGSGVWWICPPARPPIPWWRESQRGRRAGDDGTGRGRRRARPASRRTAGVAKGVRYGRPRWSPPVGVRGLRWLRGWTDPAGGERESGRPAGWGS